MATDGYTRDRTAEGAHTFKLGKLRPRGLLDRKGLTNEEHRGQRRGDLAAENGIR